jgi:ribonuclease-3
MSRSQTSPTPDRAGLLTALGVPVDAELLERSLTHRSYAYENGGLPTNERLEFLGDSVLSLVVTTELYQRHPDLPEGQLAKQRASVVNQRALADVARSLGSDGVGPYLLLGRGEDTTGGRDKPSILADTLEAIIGAIYLSSGLDVAGTFIHREFDPLLDIAADRGAGLDWKTSLQERSAALSLGPPEYTVEQFGPDHAKRFVARAVVAGDVLGEGRGGSKKEAEQHAAAQAFATLEARGEDASDTAAAGGDGAVGGADGAVGGVSANGAGGHAVGESAVSGEGVSGDGVAAVASARETPLIDLHGAGASAGVAATGASPLTAPTTVSVAGSGPVGAPASPAGLAPAAEAAAEPVTPADAAGG